MTTTNEDLQAAAKQLRDAYTHGPIEPQRDVMEISDIERAYQIQAVNTQHWIDAGRKLAGWKIGLTSKAVQQQLGVDQPDFGALFDDMVMQDGDALDMGPMIQPRAEAEIALVLGQDLDKADVTPETVAESIAYASPAIEIVDSRIKDWRIGIADTVADNGSSAFCVLGSERLEVRDLDLFSCGMVLDVDGEVVSLGAGAACMGHPFNATAWLANTLLQRGQALKAGQIIMSGALGPVVDLKIGQTLTATVGGLGTVSFAVGT